MAELKEKEKADYKKILTDPAYKQSLGLTTEASICDYLGITPVTKGKWKEQLTRVDNIKGLDIKDTRLTEIIDKLFKKALTEHDPKNARALKELLSFVEKQGDNGNREPNATDYNIIAIRTRDTLRKEFNNGSGSCPVCGFTKALHKPHINPEPELRTDNPVGTVAVPS
jgi:hypothetical protein